MALFSRSIEFLGVPVVACATDEFIESVVSAVATRDRSESPLFVTYLNAWCSNVAADDDAYAQILRQANAVYADGQAIVWASRWLGEPLPERVNAADFIIDFCRAAVPRELSLYLLGSGAGVAAAAAENFKSRVPGLHIAGSHHGFFATDEDAVIAQVAAANADILLVGMSVPLQEKWVAQNLS